MGISRQSGSEVMGPSRSTYPPRGRCGVSLQPCLTGEVGGSKDKGLRRWAHKRSAEPREPSTLPARGAEPLRYLNTLGFGSM